jgi:hypothetical protein
MEVDVVALNHVVENATYGLVEPITTPLGHRRPSLMPPPPPTQQPLHVEETQDYKYRIPNLKTELPHWGSNTTNGSWPTS